MAFWGELSDSTKRVVVIGMVLFAVLFAFRKCSGAGELPAGTSSHRGVK